MTEHRQIPGKNTHIRVASDSAPLEVWDLYVRRNTDAAGLVELDDGDRIWLLSDDDAKRLGQLLIDCARSRP
jgi:hypothetical protein